MVLVLISEFSKLFLETAIVALTHVSCYYMTSFNYGGKKARDVGLTCRCHLSNIMPDSIFCDSMEWRITYLFFKGDNHCLPQHKRWNQLSYHYSTNGLGKTLSYNGLKQMGSIRLRWGTSSRACLRIPALWFH